jgi:hypothetical protein
MPQSNDLSRSLAALDRDSTLIVVIEMSRSSWLVAGMSELLRRTWDETIRIETVLTGGLWPISVDSSQLESAIINLAVNPPNNSVGTSRSTASRVRARRSRCTCRG